MSQMKSRRELGLMVTGGVIAVSVAAGAKPALARQNNMEKAKADLRQAIEDLRAAYDDKGGHKVKAIELIQAAIDEVDAGIRFAETH